MLPSRVKSNIFQKILSVPSLAAHTITGAMVLLRQTRDTKSSLHSFYLFLSIG
jgi:hypothetical protein